MESNQYQDVKWELAAEIYFPEYIIPLNSVWSNRVNVYLQSSSQIDCLLRRKLFTGVTLVFLLFRGQAVALIFLLVLS